MTQEQALLIARNYYHHRHRELPYNLTLKRMESDGTAIILTTPYSLGSERKVYEIEINPVKDVVTMKEIIGSYKASEFAIPAKRLSELENGDLFRFQIDLSIWKFQGQEDYHGEKAFIVARKEGGESYPVSQDNMVFPRGK